MNKSRLFSFFLLFVSLSLKAQTSVSVDELFKNARQAAFDENNYPKAKTIACQALEIAPGYNDVEIFLGRIFSWTKQYDSARYHFSRVLSLDSANEDARVAYADLEYWNDHYEKALQICNAALRLFPSSEPLLMRKARILDATKNYLDANATLTLALKINAHNKEALALADVIKDATAKNKLTLIYQNSSFDKQYDNAWHLISMAYSRKTNLGTVIARVNYANRFATNGLQAELDAYPRISKTFFSYVNFGYSDNVSVFPNFRAGFSVYANLPNSFQAEVGMRYLYFASATDIYTASLGKYYKKFLFTVHTYITPSTDPVSQSYNLVSRYYLKGIDNYVELTLGSGISADDNNQNILFSNKQTNLSATKIQVDFTHSFLKWNIVSLSAGFINREYLPSLKGNQFDFSVKLSRRF